MRIVKYISTTFYFLTFTRIIKTTMWLLYQIIYLNKKKDINTWYPFTKYK